MLADIGGRQICQTVKGGAELARAHLDPIQIELESFRGKRICHSNVCPVRQRRLSVCWASIGGGHTR